MSKDTWIKAFETFAREIVSMYQIPGLAFGAAVDGEAVHTGGIGFRNVQDELAAGPDTVYGIGSITKSFTCAALMQLQERGRLSVDDAVIKWLPEFRLPAKADADGITIHHLMTHTSGLPPLQSLFNAMARSMKEDPSAREFSLEIPDLEPIDTVEELLDLIAEQEFKLLGPPGEYFSYSNDGYALLGAIIARASGQPYGTYLKENLLGPMNMTHTALDTDDVQAFSEVTELYAAREKNGKEIVYHAPGWWEFPSMESAGRLMSNVRDLLRYLEIYRCSGLVDGERILSEKSVQEMMRPHVEASPGQFYGYGLGVQPDYHGITLVGHSGGIKGVAADVLLSLEDEITAVALSNLSGAPSGAVSLGIINALKHLPPDSRRQEYDDFDATRDQLARFTGTYHSGEGASIRVYLEDDLLFADMRDKTQIGRPVGENLVVFKTKGMEMPVRSIPAINAVSFGGRIITKAEDE